MAADARNRSVLHQGHSVPRASNADEVQNAVSVLQAFLDSVRTSETGLEGLAPFAQLAEEVAQRLLQPCVETRNSIVPGLLKIVTLLADSRVASCRELSHGDKVALIGEPMWNGGQLGKVPVSKHPEDCETKLTEVLVRELDPTITERACARVVHDGTAAVPFYVQEERLHFESINSEILIPLSVGQEGIPKAMIVLGHPESGFFVGKRFERVRACHGLLNAIFQAADFAEDQGHKSVLSQKLVPLLPTIAAAPTRVSFARATCALLTSP